MTKTSVKNQGQDSRAIKKRDLWAKVFLGLAFSTLWLPTLGWAQKVVVVLSCQAELYDKMLEGFKSALPLEPEVLNMEGNLQNGTSMMQSFSPENVSVVVPVGSDALSLVKALKTEIPVVYSMVLSPMKFPGHRVSGLMVKIKVRDQFTLLKKIMPDKKRIGIVYNPRFSQPEINEAIAAAGELQLALLVNPVSKAEDLPGVLNKLSAANVDLLWMPMDEFLADPVVFKQLVKHTLQQKLPLLGFTLYQVKAGGLAAFSADYKDVGIQTAELVKQTLQTPTETLASPRKVILFMNPQVRRYLGLDGLMKYPEIKTVE